MKRLKRLLGSCIYAYFWANPKFRHIILCFLQNRGIVEVGTDLWTLSSPTALLSAGLSKQILKINYLSVDVYNDTNWKSYSETRYLETPFKNWCHLRILPVMYTTYLFINMWFSQAFPRTKSLFKCIYFNKYIQSPFLQENKFIVINYN